MSGTPTNDKHEEWQQDVAAAAAAADTTVLPEYTFLPPSPRSTSNPASPPDMQYTTAPLGAAPASSSPTADSDDDADSDASSDTGERGRRGHGAGRRIVRAVKHGLLGIVLPPVILTGAVLAAAAAMVYGSGKVVEAIGRALSIGPERLYGACVSHRARAAWRAVRGKKARRADVEREGAIAI
ncbi:hypothetical protein C8Q77DRAFT_1159133 [Trametes polyzona]|nr:hypothetical protein C8Q77DRAFT_1159133 [Trametes polyzona]